MAKISYAFFANQIICSLLFYYSLIEMEISQSRYNMKLVDYSILHEESKKSTSEKKTLIHDSPIEIDQNTHVYQVEEVLFPRGIKADLQKDIEKSSIGTYIGMYRYFTYIVQFIS